jgi:hypothetical protein
VETQASPGPYNPRKQKADLWSSIREGSLAMLKAGESHSENGDDQSELA